MQLLKAQSISRQAFAPFGWLIDAPSAVGTAINGGSSQRIDALTELAFDAQGGKPCLAIFKAKARDPAGPWVELERHCLGTQTFIPLNGVHYVVLVALGDAKPDASTLRAFTVSGQQGITLRAGTWHHGLLALSDGDFVVLERSADAVDCELAQLLEPVSIILS
jgi:ureidoglycolate lyase